MKKVNQLEEAMHQTLKKRSELVMNRRQNDVKDEIEEVSGKASTGTRWSFHFI